MNAAYSNRSLLQHVQTMDTKLSCISPAKRLAYALVGLLAGDLMLFFFLLQHALHATLLAGEPAHLISDAVQMFILYAIFSFVGWLFVGMPTALLFPASSITRLSWPLALLVGLVLGLPALFVIFALLGSSHIYFYNFAEVGTLLAYSILVSTVSFVVYLALLRKEMKSRLVSPPRFVH
jgi:hypothetical protein